MPLTPTLPPGRANRKALRFSADIVRLRQAGYTFSAIRLALLETGLEVGLSTIKREAARTPDLTVASLQLPSTNHPEPLTTARFVKVEPVVESRGRASRTGREIAEAFFDAHQSNPLFPTKDHP